MNRTPCHHLPRVHAYHDGELPSDQLTDFTAHLQSCPQCQLELASIQALSNHFRASPKPVPPADLSASIMRRVEQDADPRAIRLAWRLSAAAAVIVVACLPQMQRSGAVVNAGPPAAWELAAAIPAGDPGTFSEEHQLARWMADDLARASRMAGRDIQGSR